MEQSYCIEVSHADSKMVFIMLSELSLSVGLDTPKARFYFEIKYLKQFENVLRNRSIEFELIS